MKVIKNIFKVLFVIAGLLALFAPYEFEREENGDFNYKSWLLGINRKTDEENRKFSFWFFNKPKITGVNCCCFDSSCDEKLDNLADAIDDGFEELADKLDAE